MKLFASICAGVFLACAPSFAGAAETAVRLSASTDQVYDAVIEVAKAEKMRILSHDKEIGQIATDCMVTGRLRIMFLSDTTQCVEFTINLSKDGEATLIDADVQIKQAVSDRRHSAGQFLSINSRAPKVVIQYRDAFIKAVEAKLATSEPSVAAE